MNTTHAFNYTTARHYALDLFNEESTSYQQEKKLEALLILIGLDTGLRVTDILNLRYSDIDTDNKYGTPILIASIKKVKKVEGKHLSTTTNRLIETYYNWLKFSQGKVNDLIFYNYKTDKVYSRQWSHKRLNKANDLGLLGKKVKVAGAHSLRRTAGQHVYEKTKDTRLAQSLLGHSRMAQTEHYLKIEEQEAFERLHKVIHD